MVKSGDVIYVINSLGMPMRITKREVIAVYDRYWLLVSNITSRGRELETMSVRYKDIDWFTTLHAAKQHLFEYHNSKRQKRYGFIERNGGIEITWDDLENNRRRKT